MSGKQIIFYLGHSWLLFLYLNLFFKVYLIPLIVNQIAHDWIQTWDAGFSSNPSPNCATTTAQKTNSLTARQCGGP